MKKRTYTIVTVEGAGQFPIDMLRYDRATPESEFDSGIIQGEGRRRLDVRMEGEPCRARWESFCWKVIDARTITV